MKGSETSLLTMTAAALVGLVPAGMALATAPSSWTLAAAAGTAVAAASLLISGARVAQELRRAETLGERHQAAVATAESRLAAMETRLREAAAIDEVSGVFNRRSFFTRLDETIQRDARLKKPMAFLLIDVDDFKKINGDAGRIVGDRVLRAVGRAIQASTRGTDFVGRIGGDEFAVVLGECADPRPAIDRVFVALHGETTGGDTPAPIRVSVGAVIILEPQHGVDPAELFRLAEDALASVRGAGGGRCGKREYRVEPALTRH